MKLKLFYFAIIIFFVSCNGTKQTKIDKNVIVKMELLIADTSIIDFPQKQLDKSAIIGNGQSFVDSFGNLLCKPSHRIIFKGSDKNFLIDIFNSFSDSLKETQPTTCITLYNHVFLLYDNQNKIIEQIDFAFNCPLQFNFLKSGQLVVPENDKSLLLTKFVDKLKLYGAYIPEYGLPPSP